MSASFEYTQRKNDQTGFEDKEIQNSLRELSKKIDVMKTEINQLLFECIDESYEEDRSYGEIEEEEFKANPWIWSGSRRPRPVPYSYIQECLKDPPSNLKAMLQRVLVQDVAISNWIKKRPVLISFQQSIERVCFEDNFAKFTL